MEHHPGSPSHECTERGFEDLSTEELYMAREIMIQKAADKALAMHLEGPPHQDHRLANESLDAVYVSVERRLQAKLDLKVAKGISEIAEEIESLIAQRTSGVR